MHGISFVNHQVSSKQMQKRENLNIFKGISLFLIMGPELCARPLSILLGPNVLFLGLGKGPKTVLGSTHVVKQLSFSMLP